MFVSWKNMKGKYMNTVKDEDELRPEYKREDFGVGVRGKYYEAYNEGNDVVMPKPEVAKVIPIENSDFEKRSETCKQPFSLTTRFLMR
jgi:hypothetical protein